jgi:hypothetical protein
MISGANNYRFQELKNNLENAYTMGKVDNYPKDCEEALGMLNNFRPSGGGRLNYEKQEKDKDGL